jgi:hypothetical protein
MLDKLGDYPMMALPVRQSGYVAHWFIAERTH